MLLIAGHGGTDPGACANGYKEAELTREAARLIKPHLEAFSEVDLFDTSKDLYSCIKNGMAFDFTPYDYVLELHFNAGAKDTAGNGKTTGTEILVHQGEAGISVEEKILQKVCALGFTNRGVKRRSDLQNMNKCRKAGVSYALLEICFIDDIDDCRLYQKQKENVLYQVSRGIAEGFGIDRKEADGTPVFQDVLGHYAQKDIAALAQMGILQGDGNGHFDPDRAVTRAELAVCLQNTIRYLRG